jgi:hypothetical protein
MLKNINALFSNTGGLSYHIHSYLQKNKWQEYQENMDHWLQQIPKHSDKLVLIAPSAGYSLSYEFLKNFSSITAIDPDPLAHYLIKKKFPTLNIQCLKKDYFFLKNGSWNSSAIAELEKDFPDAQFLICNFLGQIPMIKKMSTEELTSLFLQLKSQLQIPFQSCLWASYHDIYSSSSEGALRTLKNDDPQRHVLTKNQVVVDHYTSELFNEPRQLKKNYLIWRIRKNYYHLIECVSM